MVETSKSSLCIVTGKVEGKISAGPIGSPKVLAQGFPKKASSCLLYADDIVLVDEYGSEVQYSLYWTSDPVKWQHNLENVAQQNITHRINLQ